MIIPNAVHTDLYDQVDIIPFDKIEKFFKEYLKQGVNLPFFTHQEISFLINKRMDEKNSDIL